MVIPLLLPSPAKARVLEPLLELLMPELPRLPSPVLARILEVLLELLTPELLLELLTPELRP